MHESSDCAARGGAFAGAVCLNNVCIASSQIEDGGVDAEVGRGSLGVPQSAQPVDQCNAGHHHVLRRRRPLPRHDGGAAGGLGLYFPQLHAHPRHHSRGLQRPRRLVQKSITATVVHDDAGAATVVVPDNFAGFFEFEGPGYLPSKLYPGHLLADASTFQAPFPILDTSATLSLAGVLGVPMFLNPEAGVGHFFFQIYDCFDHLAPGVSFARDRRRPRHGPVVPGRRASRARTRR